MIEDDRFDMNWVPATVIGGRVTASMSKIVLASRYPYSAVLQLNIERVAAVEILEAVHLLPEAGVIIDVASNQDVEQSPPWSLMLEFLCQPSIWIVEVFITEFEDNVYYAKIHWKCGEQRYEWDCRPSEAIALAVKKDDVKIWVNYGLMTPVQILEAELEKLASSSDAGSTDWDAILQGLGKDGDSGS